MNYDEIKVNKTLDIQLASITEQINNFPTERKIPLLKVKDLEL